MKSKVKQYAKRYFIDAFSYMALGLFASLVIGLVIVQLSRIPGLSYLSDILTIGPIAKASAAGAAGLAGFTGVLSAASPVVGAAIGVAIAYGLKHKPLVIFSSAAVGAAGYVFGGSMGCYVAVLVGAEIGGLIAGKTKMDIVLTPLITIVCGATAAHLSGPYINSFMEFLNTAIAAATLLRPALMGLVVSVAMGMILTSPISSTAIAISIGLGGLAVGDPHYWGSALAAGAATIGCTSNMMGFAAASYRENGIGGFVAQGFGTSMLQIPNIIRRPQIWLPAIFSSAILGVLSTKVFMMTNVPSGAGMGTAGFVGQFGTYEAMVVSQGRDGLWVIVYIVLLHFVAPAVLSFVFSEILRKLRIIRPGDMKLPDIS